jgi:hypothetical protein
MLRESEGRRCWLTGFLLSLLGLHRFGRLAYSNSDLAELRAKRVSAKMVRAARGLYEPCNVFPWWAIHYLLPLEFLLCHPCESSGASAS